MRTSHLGIMRGEAGRLSNVVPFVCSCILWMMTSRLCYVSGNPTSADKPMDYCQSEYFTVNCSAISGGGVNDVILIDSGKYGRMNAGRCVSGTHGKLGCAVDVTWYLNLRCSGRSHCRVYVADPVLHSVDPCNRDLSSYLEAGYACVTGASSARKQQQQQDAVMQSSKLAARRA